MYDWFEIVQTISIVITFIFINISFRQNEKSLRMSVTPRVSAFWEIKVEEGVDKVTWIFNVRNYSDFPVYVRGFYFHFPKDDEFPKVGLGGSVHIPPKESGKIWMFQISKDFWFSQDDEKKKKKTGWPVDITLETSIGDKWKARFKCIGYGELEFVSITME